MINAREKIMAIAIVAYNSGALIVVSAHETRKSFSRGEYRGNEIVGEESNTASMTCIMAKDPKRLK
jgi:hypothetical protein